MAVLTATIITELQPFGQYMFKVISCTPGAGAADEWIAAADTQMIDVVGLLGITPVGATTSLVAPSIQLNAQGTGVTIDTNMGDLGIESTAGSVVFQVAFFGIPG